MHRRFLPFFFLIVALIPVSCNNSQPPTQSGKNDPAASEKIRVILDSDANNELDDQHAIAYLLFNGDLFDVAGITVNRTFNGGDVAKHVEEAERVVNLCNLHGKVPILTGANGEFPEIRLTLDQATYDGAEAVNFIIAQAKAQQSEKLVLLPIGKLTNIALALEKAPEIAPKVRIVWLGSNYPEPGEYNQINDTAALSYILKQEVDFEIVTVRYGKPSGTDAVKVTPGEAQQRMAGKGPKIGAPVTGRHGNSFTNFGDYAVDLFSHIDLHGDPPSRALFDMAAVAIIKDPTWAKTRIIPAPRLVNNNWIEQPENPRKIILWEHFDKDNILEDFYDRMEHYVLAE